MISHKLFEKAEKLFDGIVFKKVDHYPTFTHTKSYFKGPWFNWIVPKVSPENLDIKSANHISAHEAQSGSKLSYYIPHELYPEYQRFLDQHGCTELSADSYMYLHMKNKFDLKTDDIQELNKGNLGAQITLANECFADSYNNPREYTELFEYNHKPNIKDKYFHNLLLYKNSEPVAFGFLIIDEKDDLAYLHNAGTHPKHRRKGYFDNLVKYRCNLAYEKGVKNCFAIVEKDSPSYDNYLKLGFEERGSFYLFVK